MGVTGPCVNMRPPVGNAGALHTVLKFNIPEKIPLDGEAPISELGVQSCIPENPLLLLFL